MFLKPNEFVAQYLSGDWLEDVFSDQSRHWVLKNKMALEEADKTLRLLFACVCLKKEREGSQGASFVGSRDRLDNLIQTWDDNWTVRLNTRYGDGFAQSFAAVTDVMCEACPNDRLKVLRPCSVFLKQRSWDLGVSSRSAFDVFDLTWAHLEPHWQLS